MKNFIEWLNWAGWLFAAADTKNPNLRKAFELEAEKEKPTRNRRLCRASRK